MPLNCVTITGSDDANDPNDLISIAKEFPFVEWGILVGSHVGDRFPTAEWIRDLIELKLSEIPDLKLALHVCGQHLRDISNGHSHLDELLGPQLYSFQRVQLNWHGEYQAPGVSENVLTSFCKLDHFGWDPTLIFQLDGRNDHLYEAAVRRFACVGLFDRSHGAGVLPGEWPQCSTEIGCGWAGGLGPDNLAEELPRIDAKCWAALNYWVDMETRVRTDSQLDIEKVRRCLEIANEFMCQTAG